MNFVGASDYQTKPTAMDSSPKATKSLTFQLGATPSLSLGIVLCIRFLGFKDLRRHPAPRSHLNSHGRARGIRGLAGEAEVGDFGEGLLGRATQRFGQQDVATLQITRQK